ncbi:unnamed protein product [Prorocentrum cordatum]|uniref:Uncharacterized protein n=1 Tax=Prorocentrum cordatum TaxID=2364126 RepID=A0ABN9STU1_9DINO|nr:unnamed protein product [Polarella glacialis]
MREAAHGARGDQGSPVQEPAADCAWEAATGAAASAAVPWCSWGAPAQAGGRGSGAPGLQVAEKEREDTVEGATPASRNPELKEMAMALRSEEGAPRGALVAAAAEGALLDAALSETSAAYAPEKARAARAQYSEDIAGRGAQEIGAEAKAHLRDLTGQDCRRMLFADVGCPLPIINRVAYAMAAFFWGERGAERVAERAPGASDFPRADQEEFDPFVPHYVELLLHGEVAGLAQDLGGVDRPGVVLLLLLLLLLLLAQGSDAGATAQGWPNYQEAAGRHQPSGTGATAKRLLEDLLEGHLLEQRPKAPFGAGGWQ